MRSVKKILAVTLCGLLNIPQSAMSTEFHYTLGEEQHNVYHTILQLELEEAQQLIDALKLSDPQNVSTYHLENYIDFFRVFIGEEREALEVFRTKKDGRLEWVERLSSGPYKLFAKAEIQLQWALARAKFGEEIKAGWDINKAYRWLEQNQQQYPHFELNKKSLSMIHALVGSISGIKKTLMKLFTSLDGSVALGLSEIQQLYYSNQSATRFFREEIVAIRALTALHIEADAEQAWQIIAHKEMDVMAKSPLLAFLRGSIAKNKGNTQEAIQQLDRSYEQGQMLIAYNDLLLGTALLNALNPRAKTYLVRFLEHHKGRHYIKEAYQKLAWYELILRENPNSYHNNMKKCLFAGHLEVGEDEMAYDEAKAGHIPNSRLLKARLLYDGGYYDASLRELELINENNLPPSEGMELHYRKARCHQGMNQYDLAVHHFAHVVKSDYADQDYIRCNAALQMGLIYKTQSKRALAQKMLQTALTIHPSAHKKSLHQKALMWLQRLDDIDDTTK